MNKNEKIITIPNILSFIRLMLIPVVVILIDSDEMIPALIVFLLACATDVIDGFIARHYHLQTRLGTWLDPLADKLMAICVLLIFTNKKIFPMFVLVTILLKELLMLIGGGMAIKNGHTVPSNVFGKIAAAMLNTCIGSGFLNEYLYPYYMWATYITLGAVIFAFVQYAVKYGRCCFTRADAAANAAVNKQEKL